jgi:hypothetical protein
VHPSLSSVASIETVRRTILGLLLNDVDYNIKQFMVSARIDNRFVNDTLTTLLSAVGLQPVVLLIKHTAAGFKRVLAGLLGGLLTGAFGGLLICMFVSCLFVCNTYIWEHVCATEFVYDEVIIQIHCATLEGTIRPSSRFPEVLILL